jgi:hypothetical protein
MSTVALIMVVATMANTREQAVKEERGKAPMAVEVLIVFAVKFYLPWMMILMHQPGLVEIAN